MPTVFPSHAPASTITLGPELGDLSLSSILSCTRLSTLIPSEAKWLRDAWLIGALSSGIGEEGERAGLGEATRGRRGVGVVRPELDGMGVVGGEGREARLAHGEAGQGDGVEGPASWGSW